MMDKGVRGEGSNCEMEMVERKEEWVRGKMVKDL